MLYLPLAAALGDKLDTTFYGFDMAIYRLFSVFHCEFMNKIATAFTSLGDPIFIVSMMLLAIILCFFKKTRKYGIAIGVAVVIGTAITNIIAKPLFLRIRPYNTLQQDLTYWQWYLSAGAFSESDFSFPSGHTTGAFEIAVATGLCLRKDGKKALSFVPAIFALMTGCSRIYLCVHYPTDVIGGILVGTFAGVAAYFFALLAVKIWEKTKLDCIDLTDKIKLKGKTAVTLIVAFIVVAFGASFIIQSSEGGDAQRCAYSNDNFQCYNEAKVDDDDYPPIDGKNYCKIHWNELTELQNGTK